MSPPGRGFPKLPALAIPGDDARGGRVYAEKCSVCHGPDGAGQVIEGVPVWTPPWDARSYHWGAGMATIGKAAAFIRANMPQGQEGSLSVQAAWDVATFIDGKTRLQDPRLFNAFAGGVRKTTACWPFSSRLNSGAALQQL